MQERHQRLDGRIADEHERCRGAVAQIGIFQ